MFFAQRRKSSIKLHYVIQAFGVDDRIQLAGQLLKALAGQVFLANGNQSLPRIAAPIVDEVVVQNPAKPGPGLLELMKLVHAWKNFGEHVLEQVLGFMLVASKAKGQTVQPFQMRLYKHVKAGLLMSVDRTHVARV